MSGALDVLGLGESSIDHVNLLPTAPLARGTASKLRISSAFDAAGGQVASMLAACSGLGLRTGYLGPLGNDENGSRIRSELERRGVDMSSVIVRDAPARFAIILVDESTGERTVLWHRDPNASTSPKGKSTPDCSPRACCMSTMSMKRRPSGRPVLRQPEG